MDTGCFTSDGVAQLSCVPSLIVAVIRGFLGFSGTVALFLVVWGSIKLIMAGGDAKQIAGARQIITYAIVGLIVVLSSFSIVFFVSYLTKTENCITRPELIVTGGCN